MSCLKFILSISIIFLFYSCNTSKHFPEEKKKDVRLGTVAETAFYIKSNLESDINACVSMNEELSNILKDKENKELLTASKFNFTFKDRQPLQPGKIIYGIPDRFKSDKFTLNFFLCINPKGEVLLSSLLSEEPYLNSYEIKNLNAAMMDYTYTADSSAECLECTYFKSKINFSLSF